MSSLDAVIQRIRDRRNNPSTIGKSTSSLAGSTKDIKRQTTPTRTPTKFTKQPVEEIKSEQRSTAKRFTPEPIKKKEFNAAPVIEAATKAASFLNSSGLDPLGLGGATTRLASRIITSSANPVATAVKADVANRKPDANLKLRTMRKDDGDLMEKSVVPNTGDFGKDLSISWEHGKKQLEADFATWDSAMNITDLEKKRKADALQSEADTMAGTPQGGVDVAARKGTTELIKYGIRGAVDMLPMQLESLNEGLKQAMVASMGGGIAGGVIGASATGPLAPFGAAGGAVTGATVGFKIGMTEGAFEVTSKIEAAQAYRSYRAMGLSHESALQASQIAGAVNGLLEVGEIGAIAKATPGLKQLLGGVKKEVTESVGKGLVKDFGKTYTAEVGMEVLQQGMTLASEAVARHSDKLAGYEVDDFDKSKIAGELLNTGIEAAVSMPWLLGGSMALGHVGTTLTGAHKAVDAQIADVEQLVVGNKEADNVDTASQLKAMEVTLTRVAEDPDTANVPAVIASRDKVVAIADTLETKLSEPQIQAITQNIETSMTAIPASYEAVKEAVLNGELPVDNPKVNEQVLRLFAIADKAGVVREVLSGLHDGRTRTDILRDIVKKLPKNQGANTLQLIDAVMVMDGELQAQAVERASQEILSLPEPVAESVAETVDAVVEPVESVAEQTVEPVVEQPVVEQEQTPTPEAPVAPVAKVGDVQVKSVEKQEKEVIEPVKEVVTEIAKKPVKEQPKQATEKVKSSAPAKRVIASLDVSTNVKTDSLTRALESTVSPDGFIIPKAKTFGLTSYEKQEFVTKLLKAYEEADSATQELSVDVQVGTFGNRRSVTYTIANDTRAIARMFEGLGITAVVTEETAVQEFKFPSAKFKKSTFQILSRKGLENVSGEVANGYGIQEGEKTLTHINTGMRLMDGNNKLMLKKAVAYLEKNLPEVGMAKTEAEVKAILEDYEKRLIFDNATSVALYSEKDIAAGRGRGFTQEKFEAYAKSETVASGGPIPSNVTITEPTSRAQQTASSIAETLGVTVVYFDGGADSPAGFYQGDGKLYINSKLKSGAIMRTVGHEFFHSIRQTMPEMHDEMMAFARDRFPVEAQLEYRERFKQWPEIYQRMADTDYLLEEMISDEMGSTFAREGFWSDLYQFSTSLFNRVVQFVAEFFDEVKSMPFKSTLEADTIEELQWRFGQVVSFARGEIVESGSYETRYRFQAEHTTPHAFDKFDHSKMGTGEGAQVYGWGTYLSTGDEVREYYRQTLGGQQGSIKLILPDGRTASMNEDKMIGDAYGVYNDQAVRALWNNQGNKEKSIEVLEDLAKREKARGTQLSYQRAEVFQYAAKVLAEIPQENITYKAPAPATTLKVSINSEIEHMLDWDKPLSEQSEYVQGKLKDSPEPKAAESFANDPALKLVGFKGGVTGEILYQSLSGDKGSDRAASLYLNSIGISGIKYLDGMSRKKGEGNYNFVIFDEKLMEIETRFSMQEEVYEDMSFHETVRDKTLSAELKRMIQNPGYRVIGNMETLENAVAWIEQRGIEASYDYLIASGTVATEVTNTAAMLLIDKYQYNPSTVERALNILDAVSLKANQQGRAIQALSMFGRLIAVNVQKKAERDLDKATNPKQKQERDKATKDVNKKMNELNGNAVAVLEKGGLVAIVEKVFGLSKPDKMLTLLKDDLRRGQTFQEKADAASEMLADKVEFTTKEQKPKPINPIEMMVNTLFQIAKESPLPEGVKNQPTPLELVVDAIKNREMYREVWDRAKVIVEERLADNPEALEKLDAYFAFGLAQGKFLDSQVGKLIGAELKAQSVKIRDIVRQHYSVADAKRIELSQKLIQSAGLTREDARIMEIEIQRKMFELTDKEKAKQLESLFKEKAKSRERQQLYDKIIEQSNLGAFTDDKYRRLVSEKLGLPTMTAELGQELKDMADEIQTMPVDTKEQQREKEVKTALMMKKIFDQIPVGKWRKVASVLVINQLFSAKTSLRNIISMAGLYTMDALSRAYSLPADVLVGSMTGKRYMTGVTRAKVDAFWGGMREGFAKGREDAMLGIDTFNTSNTAGDKFGRTVRTFEHKEYDTPTTAVNAVPRALNEMYHKLEMYLNVALRATDRAMVTAIMAETVQEQLEVARLNGENITEATPEMIDIAFAKGLFLTLNDENAISHGAVKLKQTLNGGNWKFDVKQRKFVRGGADEFNEFGPGNFILQYPKVPANLIARTIDYSPVGFISMALKLAIDTSGASAQDKQAVAIESFGRGMTGITVALIGFGLSAMGVIVGADDGDDWDAKALLQSEGIRNYSINTSALTRLIRSGFTDSGGLQTGDSFASYDWFQPVGALLSIGADIQRRKNPLDAAIGVSKTIMDSLGAAVNSLSEQNVLQGIRKLFGKDTMWEGVNEITVGVPSAFVPQLVRQTAAITDNTVRNSYDATSPLKTAGNMAIKGVPGASNSLEPTITPFGDTAKQYPVGTNVLLRIADKFFNPAIVKQYNPSAESELVIQLLDRNGVDAQGIAPPRPYTSRVITVDKQKYTLTPNEYRVISEWAGKEVRTRFNDLIGAGINGGSYSDAEQISALKSVVNAVDSEARDKLILMKGIKQKTQ